MNSTGVLGESIDMMPVIPIALPDIRSVATYSVTQAPITSGAKPKSAPMLRKAGPKPHKPGLERPHE